MKGSGRLRKALGRLKRRFKPGGVILVYHRVASLQSDPYSLAVSTDHFAQQLDHLAHTCHPMRLLDLIAAVQHGALPHRAVAVTFDDGYCDNYQNAYPLLASARIPATIFVISDMINSRQEFWWDDLQRILLLSARIPSHLQMTILGRSFEWQLDSAEHRQRAHNAIYKLLKPLFPQERHTILEHLANWADVPAAGRGDYRAMTRTELSELSNSGLIEIGGHTRLHPQLSALPVDEQRAEIVGGRQRLEELIGKPIETFAYPYGETTDFTDETAEVVCSAGFRAALTTIHGYVEPGESLFRLRRCAVFDWDVGTFKSKLGEFFAVRN